MRRFSEAAIRANRQLDDEVPLEDFVPFWCTLDDLADVLATNHEEQHRISRWLRTRFGYYYYFEDNIIYSNFSYAHVSTGTHMLTLYKQGLGLDPIEGGHEANKFRIFGLFRVIDAVHDTSAFISEFYLRR